MPPSLSAEVIANLRNIATPNKIKEWFNAGKSSGYTHMVIYEDPYSYIQQKIYVSEHQDAKREALNMVTGHNQLLVEVYDLKKDLESQMNAFRVFNF